MSANTNRFCVKCGAVDRPMIGPLCIDCYLEMYGLVKLSESIEIVMCPRCYAIKVHGKWIRPTSYEEFLDLIRSEILRKITPSRPEIRIDSVLIPSIEPYQSRIPVSLRAKIGPHLVEREISINIVWKKSLCPLCFKRAAGSFQAIVQLRCIHMSNDIERFKQELLNLFPDEIIEISETKNGFDVKVSSEHIARRIALLAKRKWRAVKIIESFGDQKRRRDGRRTAKLYISVRILNYQPGDYVVIDRKAYIVEFINDGSIVLRDSAGKKKVLRVNDLPRHITKIH